MCEFIFTEVLLFQLGPVMSLAVTFAVSSPVGQFLGLVSMLIILNIMMFSWVYINMYLDYTSKKLLKRFKIYQKITCFTSVKALALTTYKKSLLCKKERYIAIPSHESQ